MEHLFILNIDQFEARYPRCFYERFYWNIFFLIWHPWCLFERYCWNIFYSPAPKAVWWVFPSSGARLQPTKLPIDTTQILEQYFSRILQQYFSPILLQYLSANTPTDFTAYNEGNNSTLFAKNLCIDWRSHCRMNMLLINLIGWFLCSMTILKDHNTEICQMKVTHKVVMTSG